MSARDLWRRGQEGWPRSYPVAQFPNAPLLVALAGSLLARVAGGGGHDIGRAVFIVGLAVWAWGEATDGVNGLRRVLGAGALVWLVVSVAGDL